MENNTTLSPELSKEVKDAFDRMYDRGVDHAILVVKSYSNNMDTSYDDDRIKEIISQLEKLKSNKA